MGKVNDIPSGVSDAGKEHNYQAGGLARVVLVSAPLDADYKNIAVNRAAVDSYIAGEVAAGRAYEAELNWVNPDAPVQLDVPIAAGSNYNYMRATIGGRPFYAFLTREFANQAVTRFHPTVDAWTTYQPRIGYSHVERGHIAVAAARNDGSANRISYLSAPEPDSHGPLVPDMTATWSPFSESEGDLEIFAISTTRLDVTREEAFALMPQVGGPDNNFTNVRRLDMEQVTSTMPQLSDSGSAGGGWSIGTYWNGTIESGGAWPLPKDPATAISGFQMGEEAREPRMYPYMSHLGNQIPVVQGDAVARAADGLTPGATMYRFENIAGYHARMRELAGVPWVVRGIQAVWAVPRGEVDWNGTRRATTGNSAQETANVFHSYYQMGSPTADSDFHNGWNTTQRLNSTLHYIWKVTSARFSKKNTARVTITDNWRAPLIAANWDKLAAPQYTRVEITNREGSTAEVDTATLPNRLRIMGSSSSYRGYEGDFWLETPSGGDLESVHVSAGIELPRWERGPDSAYFAGAAVEAEAQVQAKIRWYTEVWNLSFARYGALAQDGFPTVLQRAIGNALGAGF